MISTESEETSPVNQKTRSDSSTKDFVEIAKNLFEIAAIIIGGWWALHTFGEKERPGLEPHFETSIQLKWHRGSTQDTCIADWNVWAKNIGGSAVEVGSTTAQVWTFEPPSPPQNGVAYVDLNALRPAEKSPSLLFKRDYSSKDGTLNGHYPPNQSFDHSFVFVIPKQPGKWIAFEVYLYDADGKKIAPLTYAYDWEEEFCSSPSGAQNPAPKTDTTVSR